MNLFSSQDPAEKCEHWAFFINMSSRSVCFYLWCTPCPWRPAAWAGGSGTSSACAGSSCCLRRPCWRRSSWLRRRNGKGRWCQPLVSTHWAACLQGMKLICMVTVSQTETIHGVVFLLSFSVLWNMLLQLLRPGRLPWNKAQTSAFLGVSEFLLLVQFLHAGGRLRHVLLDGLVRLPGLKHTHTHTDVRYRL